MLFKSNLVSKARQLGWEPIKKAGLYPGDRALAFRSGVATSYHSGKFINVVEGDKFISLDCRGNRCIYLFEDVRKNQFFELVFPGMLIHK